MSAKRGRRAKVLPVPRDQRQLQKGSSLDQMDSPNLSAIERASFLEELQPNYGNPLHSTAMEEDINVLEKGQTDEGKAGREDIPQTLKTAGKQRGAAVKRKAPERGGENEEEEEEKKRSRRRAGGRVEARPEKEGETPKKKKGAPERERGELDAEGGESDPSADLQKSNQPTSAASSLKHLGGKKPAKRRGAGQTSAARPGEDRREKKDYGGERDSGSGTSSDPASQEESDTDAAQQRRGKVLSSDDEAEAEDTSWNPSPKKAKMYGLSRTRKSSSEKSKSRKSSSGSTPLEPDEGDKQRGRRAGRRGGSEFDVALDAFLSFCAQYRESVESKAVTQSIDSFSSNVKEQLLEKISSYKELKVLKRENAKVASLIRTKTQRLLDAKHELMRAERQVWLLQKEKAELKLRLADLRRGQAFLHDIRELNGQYLDYRHKHPKERETYGASSLPALLLEAKRIQVAEHQLRGIHNRRGGGTKNGARK